MVDKMADKEVIKNEEVVLTEELKDDALEIPSDVVATCGSNQPGATETKKSGKTKLDKNEEEETPKTDFENTGEAQNDANEPVASSERNIPKKITNSVPSCFNNSEPQPFKESFIYIIRMNLEEPIGTETNDLNIKLEDPSSCPISLGILINKEIPQIPDFPIFSTYGLMKIKLVKGKNFTLSEEQMENIQKFHKVVFEDLLELTKHRTFVPSDSPMPFYIVPIKNDLSCIEWNTIKSIKKQEVQEIKQNMYNDFEVTASMFTYGISWLPIYTKTVNKISKTVILENQQKKIYLEYIMRKLSAMYSLPEMFMQILSMPVILYRINSLLMAENFIQNVARFEKDKITSCDWGYFKIEEKTSVPSSDIVKEKNIITSYLQKTKNSTPSPCEVLEAMTLKTVNDVFNLEKLEILGDTFLKLSTTLHLFSKYQNYSSQDLIKIRTSIINNVNLCNKAKNRNLDEFIIRDAFNEHIMIAPCYTDNTENKNIKENETIIFKNAFQKKKVLNYKKIADVVESTIGVYLLSTGQQGAIKFMRWMGLLSVKNSNNDDCTTNWPPGLLTEDSTIKNINISQNLHVKIKNFEANINYSFKNKRFLLEAVRYSKQEEIRFKYDRLCLLGDSILEFFTIRNFYEEKTLSPSELHHRKAALVSKDFKGCIAMQLKMQQFFDDDRIKEFASTFETNKSFIYFKNHGYLDYESDDTVKIDVPRSLGQMLNAVIGAVYLDNQMDLNCTWKIFCPMLQPTIAKMKENFRLHPITEYEQLMQQMKERFICVSAKEGEDFMVKIVLPDQTEVVGRAKRIQVAKRLAAIQALHKLKTHNS